MAKNERNLTTRGLALLAGVARETVARWTSAGLPHGRRYGSNVFSPLEVVRWLNATGRTAAPGGHAIWEGLSDRARPLLEAARLEEEGDTAAASIACALANLDAKVRRRT